MKRNSFTVLIVLLSSSILFVTLLILPRVDVVQPDPYFHVKITPITYWIGFCLAIFVTFGVIFSKREVSGRYSLGLFSVVLLSIYVYVVPKLFYITPIYVDTYIFVGELLYTLRSGHVGWGHSYGTPGLDLFSSQFSLITVIDHIIVAEVLQLIMPLITVFFIYVVSQLFVSKRTALLTCLAYISIDWIGFDFNRQSFAWMLQIFVYFSVFRVFSRRAVQLSWYSVILMSYIALVFSHPLSSLIMIISPLSLVLLLCLRFLVGRIWPTRALSLRRENVETRSLITRALLLSAMFSVIWLSWNMYTETNLYYAIQTIDLFINKIFTVPRPVQRQAASAVIGYTGEYHLIVNIRFTEVIFEGIVGSILACIAFIKIKTSWKGLILSSWFVSCISIFGFGLHSSTSSLLYKTFLYVSLAFSLLLAWFMTSKIRIYDRTEYNGKVLLKAVKGFILSAMMFFMLILPLTMYSHTPFMYPPTVYLRELSHITIYGKGTIAIFEGSSEIGYYQLLSNSSATFTVIDNTTNITDYMVIATGFRAYSLEAFIYYKSPLIQSIMDLENEFMNNPNPAYAKVYDADSWHQAYAKQFHLNYSQVMP